MESEILVRFQPDVEPGRRLKVLERFGCAVKEEILPQGILVVRCPSAAALPEILEQLSRLEEVLYAETNREVRIMNTPMNTKKKEQGAMLVLALLGLTTITILAGAFYEGTLHDQKFSERSQGNLQAFYLAESGVDRGLNWLRNELVAPQWTDRRMIRLDPQTKADGWNSLGTSGWYMTAIDPDDSNRLSQIKRYTIEGWGAVGGALAAPASVRQTRLMVQTESFAQYAYFTNSEQSPSGAQVWFITGDRIEGPTHTNGQFHMYGKPVFQGPVSSVARNIVYWGGESGFTQPVFQEPPKLGVPAKKFPKAFPAGLVDAAGSGGTVLDGNTAVTLLPSGAMQVTNAKKGWVNQEVPLPANGVLYVNGGNLALQGQLKGQMTIGASGDIRVVDSVTYSDDPRLNPKSKDILGIVAGGNMVIPKEAPTNLRIDATVMAIKTSFGVENWWEGPPRGTLGLYGGLIQANRGPVGRFDPSSGRKLSGYTKDYHYDNRLKMMSPPFFPTTGDYRILAWKGEKEE